MTATSYYDNPLIGRYASPEMSTLWGPQRKFSTWRRLWVALAEAEAQLGLPISKKQIDELAHHVDDIDFAKAADLGVTAASIGETVRVNDGPFKDFEGKVAEKDETRGKVKVLVSMFGRETPVELDFLQVEKL